MNFLAHLYLSGDDPMLLSGNFIGDSVKGRYYTEYPEQMQRGIDLHRAIDTFTDMHPVVLREKSKLTPEFRKYAGVVLDVFYDHFLARNWDTYHEQNLKKYVRDAYSTLEDHKHFFPDRSKEVLFWMKQHDWLYNYRKIEGIERSMKGMARRTKFHSNMENAHFTLQEMHHDLEKGFLEFFPDIIDHTQKLRSDYGKT